jgi:hypothetical protein
MNITEKELSTDMNAIMHILTAPPARDDSEAEWERVLEMDSAWVGFQDKYPQDFLSDLEGAINDVLDVFAEKLTDGDYGDE